MAGILAGLALAFSMELKNTSFRSEKDLLKYIAAPFVVEVPVLHTLIEQRQLEWKSARDWLISTVMIFIVMIAEYYIYKRG